MITLNCRVDGTRKARKRDNLAIARVTDLAACENAVRDTLDVGYRLLDTAQSYGNETAVSAAIKKSGVAREELPLPPLGGRGRGLG